MSNNLPICPKCHTQRLRCANGCTWEVTDKPIRSQEPLESFAAYCQANPQQRFWQALRNWSEYNFVYVSNISPLTINENGSELVEDTFYREGK